jgi:hypothetical protein
MHPHLFKEVNFTYIVEHNQFYTSVFFFLFFDATNPTISKTWDPFLLDYSNWCMRTIKILHAEREFFRLRTCIKFVYIEKEYRDLE